jgi:hypothetical protein
MSVIDIDGRQESYSLCMLDIKRKGVINYDIF